MKLKACDKCEIQKGESEFVPNDLVLEVGDWKFQTRHAYRNIWNKGDICWSCFKKLFNKGLRALQKEREADHE